MRLSLAFPTGNLKSSELQVIVHSYIFVLSSFVICCFHDKFRNEKRYRTSFSVSFLIIFIIIYVKPYCKNKVKLFPSFFLVKSVFHNWHEHNYQDYPHIPSQASVLALPFPENNWWSFEDSMPLLRFFPESTDNLLLGALRYLVHLLLSHLSK